MVLPTEGNFSFVPHFKSAFYEVMPKYETFSICLISLTSLIDCCLYFISMYCIICVAVLADGDRHCAGLPGCNGYSVDGSELGTEA